MDREQLYEHETEPSTSIRARASIKHFYAKDRAHKIIFTKSVKAFLLIFNRVENIFYHEQPTSPL